MNERMIQFLAAENISQSQFADTIGVARASVSHIVAGRNKPGYDFIKSMMEHYPSLNIEWLLAGRGKMYKNRDTGNAEESPSMKSPDADRPEQLPEEPGYEYEAGLFSEPEPQKEEKAPEIEAQTIDNQRKIERIIVLYDDGTFQDLC